MTANTRPYVVLTAHDARLFNDTSAIPDDIISLNQLLERRAETHPESIAAAFSRFDGREWSWDTWSFSKLLEDVYALSTYLTAHHEPFIPVRSHDTNSAQHIVALLSPSCSDFLLTLFACMRLGLGVLLIAPQNTPKAVAALCQRTNAAHLIYHESMSNLAHKASLQHDAQESNFLVCMPEYEEWNKSGLRDGIKCIKTPLTPEEEADSVAIIFHSSGSSGMPKPIPQTHRVWTKPLPYHPGPPAYTTTPLFHGGISDFLRALKAASPLYFYPSTLPITSLNICSSLLTLQTARLAPAQYFLSVPYILALLAETPEGLAQLKTFDLVSTGGAPMPMELGNQLVNENVNLVSRYGSSECGFLMTSDRDYEHDKEWSYLRTSNSALNELYFEPYGEDEYLLRVAKSWPSRSISNEPDGSFTTGDLFKKHSTIEGAWTLTGRSDDVLLMSNGEKASPAPLETTFLTIANSNKDVPLVSSVLIFGSNRASIGALVFPHPSSPSLDKDELNDAIQAVNKLAPKHAQLSIGMVVIMEMGREEDITRASKGTLMRGRAYDVFKREIEQAYERVEVVDESQEERRELKGEQLMGYMREVVLDAMGKGSDLGEVSVEVDLFAMGVDSLQSVRIRNVLQQTVELNGRKLPSNIVFECGNIRNLCQYIDRLGSDPLLNDTPSIDEQELKLMVTLRQRFSKFDYISRNEGERNLTVSAEHVLLTGATGALGAHLVAQLTKHPRVASIICLVRAKTASSARARVEESLRRRKLWDSIPNWDTVEFVPAELEKDDFGLGEMDFQRLSRRTTLIIHAAWSVNFVGRLGGFEPQLKGLVNLINLMAPNPSSRFFFCSSTAAILAQPTSTPLYERISNDPREAVSMGYARSKHVAESICANATISHPLSNRRIGILRLGQLCGDTQYGVWNETEGWPLMIASAALCGALPDLHESPAWLPIDRAARSIMEITLSDDPLDGLENPPVYHILNTETSTPWSSILTWLGACGLEFEVIAPGEWVDRLKACEKEGQQHPCLTLLDLWEASYGDANREMECDSCVFDVRHASRVSSTIAHNQPISEDLVRRMVAAWVETGFIRILKQE